MKTMLAFDIHPKPSGRVSPWLLCVDGVPLRARRPSLASHKCIPTTKIQGYLCANQFKVSTCKGVDHEGHHGHVHMIPHDHMAPHMV